MALLECDVLHGKLRKIKPTQLLFPLVLHSGNTRDVCPLFMVVPDDRRDGGDQLTFCSLSLLASFISSFFRCITVWLGCVSGRADSGKSCQVKRWTCM